MGNLTSNGDDMSEERLSVLREIMITEAIRLLEKNGYVVIKLKG
jgi:hypothetical protein